MANSEMGRVGDIGATNARFSLLHSDGTMTRLGYSLLQDYPDIVDAFIN